MRICIELIYKLYFYADKKRETTLFPINYV